MTEELREFNERVIRNAARIGSVGFGLSLVALMAGYLIDAYVAPPDTVVLASIHFVGILLRGFGLGFAIMFLFMAAAGVFGLVFSRQRKLAALIAVVAAFVALLFVPICWSPTSDDCRTVLIRARDAIASIR